MTLAKLKRLPKGIQSFAKLIEGDYIYVDKTKHIYDLITQGTYYFFSRPRRFGKSLLISTLAELFAGNRSLFKNLWIDTSDYTWTAHPIIELSFSALSHTSGSNLQADLIWKLEQIGKKYTIDLTHAPSLQTKFAYLIEQLARIEKVVILIDEYDYAILSNINDLNIATECQKVLRDFFAVIKDIDRHLKFVFLTGVSKFSKTAIFSGLNNLDDISLNTQGATILGYTHHELITYFADHIAQLAHQLHQSPDALVQQMITWYDGYQFSKHTEHEKLFNPYSVLLFLSHGEFLDYWFETGTPRFLMDLIKAKQFPIMNLEHIEANAHELGTFEIDDISLKTILFQTGYLTIESYNATTHNYHLRFPNFEVESSFLKQVLKKLSSLPLSTINDFNVRLLQALKNEQVDLFCKLLQTFFADIPSTIHIPLERYYQTIIYVLAKILGLSSNVEVSTNIGRIDLVIEFPAILYIFEFKIKGSAQQAIHQIEEKQYAQKFKFDNKKVITVGILFNTKKKNIEEWLVANDHT